MIMEYPLTRSWWEQLDREQLEHAALDRGQQWKAQTKNNVSFQVKADAFRDGWDLGIVTAQRMALHR